jgi:predicted acetyltransferase
MDTLSLAGEVEVVEAVSESVEGHRQIWRYLLDLDLMKTVSASFLPIDHPLILMLEDPQKMDMRIRRGLWVRIVDLAAALRARAFGRGSVVIQVVDTFFPHNEGAWRVSPDEVSRVTTSPDLTVDIADLGLI